MYHHTIKLACTIVIAITTISPVHGAALIGGHMENKNSTELVPPSVSPPNTMEQHDYPTSDYYMNSADLEAEARNEDIDIEADGESSNSEDIPAPSPLVLPGYNLPEHLFNNGKPFYVEKDPLTGQIDFNSKTSSDTSSDYEYEDQQSHDIYDKANIDRKDGGADSHRTNDVNQLSPNFHDYLNLPVKYTSIKYAYPLISSSYANTKIQGNNKNTNSNSYNNHKNYDYRISTVKPPTYYTSSATTTTTTTTTTHKPVSLFNELFNVFDIDKAPDYTMEEQEQKTTEKPVNKNKLNISPPPLFANLPSNKNQQKPVQKQTNKYQENINNASSLGNNGTQSINSEITANREKPIRDENNNYFDVPVSSNSHAPQYLPSDSGEDYSDYEYESSSSEDKPHLFETHYGYNTRPSLQPYGGSYGSYNVYPKEINKLDNNYHSSAETTQNPVKNNAFLNKPLPPDSDYDEEILITSEKMSNSSSLSQNSYEDSTKESIRPENISNDSLIYDNMKDDNKSSKPTPSSEKVVETSNKSGNNYDDDYESDEFYESTTLNDVISEEHLQNDNKMLQNNNKMVNSSLENKTVIAMSTVTTAKPTEMVTSLPLGMNHPKKPVQPFAIAQNLSSEKINMLSTPATSSPIILNQKPMDKPVQSNNYNKLYSQQQYLSGNQQYGTQQYNPVSHTGAPLSVPSKSNVHIAPDEDMVAFVVGHQQSVDSDGHFIGSSIEANPYGEATPFRPLYNVGEDTSVEATNYKHVYKQPIHNVQQHATITVGHSPLTMSEVINESPSKINGPLPLRYPAMSQASSVVNIKPVSGSETSLSIGIPPGRVESVPGQVVDEKLDLSDRNNENHEHSGSIIKFPDEKLSDRIPETDMDKVLPPPPPPYLNAVNGFRKPHPIPRPHLPEREILSLNSQPMFHQLPSDLTPPSEEQHIKPPRIGNYPRPPWDPRPGHFYPGRPEYARPPRPGGDQYKRNDGPLPNILPQFRPNSKGSNGHYSDHSGGPSHGSYQRQPLLDRQSNRPIGFFEKLHPPPPPPSIPPKRLMPEHLRKVPDVDTMPTTETNRRVLDILGSRYSQKSQDRLGSEPTLRPASSEHFGFLKSPPNPPKIPERQIASRRNGETDEPEVATLQMIQAKQVNNDLNLNFKHSVKPGFKIDFGTKNKSENPLYVVYPVNSPPLKLDIFDSDKKETVVIGTRGEQPLPPSKIVDETFEEYEDHKPLLQLKDRNDSPLLKPQPRPNFPIKSDFPYPLERPDPSVLNPPVPEVPVQNLSGQDSHRGNILDNAEGMNNDFNLGEESTSSSFNFNNNWASTLTDSKSRIINVGHKNSYDNAEVISATLKTGTDRPIAIAYTPTEPPMKLTEKYSVPNYAGSVIPEIRKDGFISVMPEIRKENYISQHKVVGNSDSEITVSAIMHTHPQLEIMDKMNKVELLPNHKLDVDSTDVDTTHVPTKLEFQAPFQASVSIDSPLEGWSVVRKDKMDEMNDKMDTDVESEENLDTDGTKIVKKDFDIENFKPQLFGGFKPIYDFPENDKVVKSDATEPSDRGE